MSRILITGVDGFTGRYLAELLARQDNEIVGISHNSISAPVAGLAMSHVCDLANSSELNDIIADIRPDKVVHLAAIAYVSHGVIEDIYKTNVIGSRNLLEAISLAGGVSAVLMASSANVYGNRISGEIDEEISPDPINDYAVSKLSMEFVTRLYKDRLPISIARPFNYTGVGQSVDFIIPKIIDHVRRNDKQLELGNLDVARDFSDVRDVVYDYAALLSTPDAIGKIFNICSGKAYSLHDVISIIQEISGHNFEIRVNSDLIRNNEVKTLWGNRRKIYKFTNRNPSYDLRETIEWMVHAAK